MFKYYFKIIDYELGGEYDYDVYSYERGSRHLQGLRNQSFFHFEVKI